MHGLSTLEISLDRNEGSHHQKKWHCPSCGKKRYVRYYDFSSGDYLPYEFGRCDREENCGYFEKYTKEGKARESNYSKPARITKNHQNNYRLKPEFTPIDKNLLKGSMAKFSENVFVVWLISIFGEESVKELIKRYFIGTSGKKWKGATAFWYIDIEGKIRTAKVMLYTSNGKRTKCASWMHAMLKLDKPPICFFGEHLLKQANPDQIVAIVESEKTAIIASHFFPQFIWLATGGENMLNTKKCGILANRKVLFFPDHSEQARNRWSDISREANRWYHLNSSISTFCSDINDGSDIADYLLKLPIDTPIIKNSKQTFTNRLTGKTCEIEINEHGYPAMWDN